MNLKPWVGFLVLIAIISLPIFAHLDELSVQKWDEARQAENALEMKMNGNYLVTYFNGHTESYNTKPPLLIWLQVLCMNILGVGELAVRLPSALAALFTCILIYWLFAKKYGQPIAGIICSVILVTCEGYICLHVSRTGDYDALLTLFTTAACIYFFIYVEEGKPKYLNITIVCLVLGVLTKGVAALMFLPALFFYALYRKRIMPMLKQKQFYIGILAFLVFAVGYYLLREKYDPGFIKNVWYNELGGRYAEAIEQHGGGFWSYIEVIKGFCDPWYLFILPGALAGLLTKNKWLRQLTIFLLISSVSFFIIISMSATKHPWYPTPLYPLLSVLAGIFIYSIFKWLSELKYGAAAQTIIPLVLLIAVFLIPFRHILSSVYNRPEPSPWAVGVEDMAEFMKGALRGEKNVDNYTMIKCDTNQQNLFWYSKALLYAKRPVHFVNADTFRSPGKYVVYTPETKTYIEKYFEYTIAEKHNSVYVYELRAPKIVADSMQRNEQPN